MTAVRDIFSLSAMVTIGYFVLLNGLYILFTLIAFRSLASHLRRRTYGTLAEAFNSPFSPGITVIVPAYNEAAGIAQSVRSLLGLRYPRYEIIVVNDGSTDSTLAELEETFGLVPAHRAVRDLLPTRPVRASFVARSHPNLWVLDKENGGKADALNAGISAARYPYVCAIDADAMIEPEALLLVAAPILDDPGRVFAAGGIVRIANGCLIDQGRINEIRLPRSRLAALQVIEYFRAFLVGRMGWTSFNALLIISGAFGIFRREIVEATGGYWTGSVGEDVELVVRLHRYLRGCKIPYRVVFVPDPVCWTEAPEDFGSLSRQRRRWHRGMGETLWRHRRAIGNPRYGLLGLVVLPYFLIFEFFGPVIEVTGVIMTIAAFSLGVLSVTFLVAFLITAFMMGILVTVGALTLEEFNFRRHPRGADVARMMFWAVLENLGFRQLNDLWRTVGVADLVFGKQGWGSQRRGGIGARDRRDPAGPR